MIRRVSSFRRVWLAVLVSAIALAPAVGAAQVRPDTIPRDTVPPDTVAQDTVPGDTLRIPIPPEAMARDTLPADSAREATPDSMIPAPRLPETRYSFPVGFGHARWEWDRQELLRYHGLSLLELLERVPGLLVTRMGGFGRPAGVSFLHTGGGTVRVFRDGFEVDPLVSATLDLQQIGLGDIESVRVERLPGEVRIELTTFQLEDRRAFSQVEAATGNFEAKILRALFSRVVGGRNVVSGTYDLASTNGFTRDEPYSFGSGRVRWTHSLSERAGLQAEYRYASVQREVQLNRFPTDSALLEHSTRQELVLRGRAELRPGLTVEGIVARTTRAPSDSDSTALPRRTDPFHERLSSTQVAVRTGYRLGPGFLEAEARYRGGDAAGEVLPGLDLFARSVVRPVGPLTVEGEIRSVSMDDGQATRLAGSARIGPVGGMSAFASLSAGERWVGTIGDTIEVRVGEDSVLINGRFRLREDTIFRPQFGSERASAAGLRAGVEWSGWGARLGAAYLSSAATVVVPYSLAFDRGIVPRSVGAASGVEAYGSVPLPFPWPTLRLEGRYVNWLETGDRPYLPLEQGQLGVEFHGIFFDGELEPTLRVEAVYRGSSLAPAVDRSAFNRGSEAYSMANLFLQIRIQDVRAFLIFENFLNNRTAADIPELPLAGPRTIYGIRWYFRN